MIIPKHLDIFCNIIITNRFFKEEHISRERQISMSSFGPVLEAANTHQFTPRQNSPLRNIIAKFGFCAKKIAQSFRPMRQMFDSFKSIQTRVKKQSRDWTRPRCFTRACRTRKDVYYIQPEPDSSSQVENTNLFRTFLTLFLSRKGRLLYICISTNYARETQILDMFTSFMYY